LFGIFRRFYKLTLWIRIVLWKQTLISCLYYWTLECYICIISNIYFTDFKLLFPFNQVISTEEQFFIINMVFNDSILFRFYQKWERKSCNIMKSLILHCNFITWWTEIFEIATSYMFLYILYLRSKQESYDTMTCLSIARFSCRWCS